jgi:CobQ-like glutamine amidotransferase family enzyme
MSRVGIALLFPELLGTYGDGGNATVLQKRLEWRGLDADVVRVGVEDPVPSACDVYVLGGGEDAPQTFAARRLADGGFPETVAAGAAVFAVCAGLQILGTSFTGSDGAPQAGLGIVDCATRPRGSRMIGELVVEPTGVDLPLLTGFGSGSATATVLSRASCPVTSSARTCTGPRWRATPRWPTSCSVGSSGRWSLSTSLSSIGCAPSG